MEKMIKERVYQCTLSNVRLYLSYLEVGYSQIYKMIGHGQPLRLRDVVVEASQHLAVPEPLLWNIPLLICFLI